ncbi:hypothetical protein GCM10011363_10240 [Marivita lacus]|uniref:DUF1413 domain-containing protein n=1 Tax=Marivita lacus TaxID=1323742 RepID=A0ABQ1KID5_9RHOB|nr:hypothetical protein [Marivita lacus]GGB95495.1 hypothetical protein GCM10011363_10240 [Marivita lacus]
MTELQKQLWAAHGGDFLERLEKLRTGPQYRLEDVFAADWEGLGDGTLRQNIGRAISAAFLEKHPDIDPTVFEQTVVNGTPNRMQYRRLK